MKNLVLTVALFVGAGAFVSAQGQNADQKTAAVKPAGSASQTVLDSWNEIGRKLIAIAEDFPEDKYDFKPVPAQRTFAEQLLHASGVNYYFTNVVLGEKPPASENPPRDQFKSKAAIVEYLKKSFADGAAAIQKKGQWHEHDGGRSLRPPARPGDRLRLRFHRTLWRALWAIGGLLPCCRIGAARVAP